MRILGVLVLALKGFVRSHRRTLTSILGITLAIAFLSGTLIAIDSSARAGLEGLLAGVRGDFAVFGLSGDPKELLKALEPLPGVDYVSVFYRTPLDIGSADGSQELLGTQLLFVDPANLPRSLQGGAPTGSLELPRGTIALTEPLATDLGVGLGGRVTLRNVGWDPVIEQVVSRSLNLTVSATLAPSLTEDATVRASPWDPFVHIRDADWFAERLGPTSEGQQSPGGNQPRWEGEEQRSDPVPLQRRHIRLFSFDLALDAEVWIDRAQFLNPWDVEASEGRITRLRRALEETLDPYGGSISDHVSIPLRTYGEQVAPQRFTILSLSTPVLLLGLYLGALGVGLAHAERRRELAVLRIRGAGRGQVLRMLLLEAALGGLLAGSLGLLAGPLLGLILIWVANPLALTVAPSFQDLVLSPDTILLTVLFGLLFMVLASARSATRTVRMPFAENLSPSVPEESRITYRPTVDIILVGTGAIVFTGVWSGGASRSAPALFVSFLGEPLFLALLPIAAVLLILGFARLLTKGTGRTYAWAAHLWKPVAGNLHPVVRSNIARNPRRAADVATIVSLSLAFGLFVFAFLGSTTAYQARVIRADIGADVTVWPLSIGEVPDLLQRVEGLDSVAAVSPFQRASVSVYGEAAEIFALDPETFFSATQPEPWWFEGLSVENAADALRRTGSVLVSRRLADTLFLEVGDRIPVINVVSRTLPMTNVTVAGIVRALPGTVDNPLGLPEALYGSFATLEPILTRLALAGVLVDLHPGADAGAVRQAIRSVLGHFLIVGVYEDKLALVQDDPIFRASLGFIYVVVAFVILVLTVGVGLVLYATALNRDVEFAAIRARGARKWQTAGILLGEAGSVLLVGVGIGLALGLLAPYLLLELLLTAPAGPEGPLVPLLLEVPAEAFLLVGLATLAMVLTALLISWRVARLNLGKVLKIRGG